MKKILTLSFIAVWVSGIMAGCSKNEQPVQTPLLQEQPLQEPSLRREPVREPLAQGPTSQQGSNAMSAKSLQDVLSKVDAQAQKALGDARARAGEAAAEVVPANAAEVPLGMIESYQGVNVSANTLKQNMEARGQSAEIGLTNPEEAVVPALTGFAKSSVAETGIAVEGENANMTGTAVPLMMEVVNTDSESAATPSAN